VGLPKTGTTSVQLTLAANRRRLADQGLLYPGSPRHSHFLQTLDFRQMRFGAVGPADVAGMWDSLREEVHAWPGRALISHELLAGATTDEVGRLTEQFASRPVHVLVSVRDVSRLLPAVWQERAKNEIVESWTDFRAGVALGADAEEPHPFWRLHDVEKVIRTWREHLPDHRIHVVTLPAQRTETDLLFERLCTVLEIDPAGFAVPTDPANASIGGLELAVLRELNVVAQERLDRATYTNLVKRFLVPQLLATRPGQVKVALPEDDRPWVETYTRRVCATISAGDIELVGTVEDLTPTNIVASDPADPAQSGDFRPALVARALAEVTVELLAMSETPEAGPGDRRADRAGGGKPRAGRRARSLGRAIRRRMAGGGADD
jgi:hypothetical protein